MENLLNIDENQYLSSIKRPIVGYFCSYLPLELMYVFGHPVRVFGMDRAIQRADSLMHTNVCPHCRSCLDSSLEGELDYLSGAVFIHSCDAMRRLSEVWRNQNPGKFWQFVDLPKKDGAADIAYFRSELDHLQRALKEYFHKEPTIEELKSSFAIYAKLREQLRILYQRRMEGTTDVTGGEFIRIVNASSFVDPFEFLPLLENFVKERGSAPFRNSGVRIMLTGNLIHHPSIFELIENSGASIVADNLCTSARAFDISPEWIEDYLGALASAYLLKPPCARMMDEKKEIDYILDIVKKSKADGVIFHSLKFCDSYIHSVPHLKEVFDKNNIRSLFVEGDYTTGSFGQLQTRIEAFVEMIN